MANTKTTKANTKANTKSTKPAANKAQSKKAQAIKIVTRMRARKNAPARKTILAELVAKVGMSESMAATYYQNITSGKWS